MAVSSRAVVELVLLGPSHDRRQLQDSPILGDVWAEFAAKPAAAIDLLISPYRTQPAGPVAIRLADRLAKFGVAHPPNQEAHVAYLQGIVAARLYFSEVLGVVVPMTSWWHELRAKDELANYLKQPRLHEAVGQIVEWSQAEDPDEQSELATRFSGFSAMQRYVALAALILHAGRQQQPKVRGVGGMLETVVDVAGIVEPVATQLISLVGEQPDPTPLVWQVSLNRKAMPALERSIPAVKADAAKSLFKVKCDEIAWAILDSGIDATHPALADSQGKSRVVKAFDFSNIREVVSLDNLHVDADRHRARIIKLLKMENPGDAEVEAAARKLKMLAEDADNDRPINWSLVGDFVEIKATKEPHSNHGTHVAGILASNAQAPNAGGFRDGMCPDIRLYDFRVLGRTLQDTEFAVIAALQYVRYLNERHTFISVHGVNLSLSIPHDVRNFACGRTPICNECERLVDSGVVVVAAAGNLGYHSFETKDGSYEGYTAFSITDPGNADGVITVGATHRFWPTPMASASSPAAGRPATAG